MVTEEFAVEVPPTAADATLEADQDRLSRGVLVAAFGLIGLQLALILVFSTAQYARYGLTNDFGGYAQAWQLIGHGHLDPYVSLFGVDFLHNNLDLAMYPLALVGRAFPNPVMLSYAQDLAVAATETIALMWVRDVLRSRQSDLGVAVNPLFLLAAFLLAFNPWSWETMAFSMHFGAFATFFAVLAARDLWRGRPAWVLLWVPLAAGSESLGSLYVLVAGAGALLCRTTSRRGRRWAPGVTMAGVVGLLLVTRLGFVGQRGGTLTGLYGYLLPPGARTPGADSLLLGLVSHPSAAASVFGGHLTYVFGYVVAGGLVGLAGGWGVAAVTLVLVPNALASVDAFIAYVGAFQTWPIEPFLVVSSVMVTASLVGRVKGARSPAIAPILRAVGAVVVTITATATFLEVSTLARRWISSVSVSNQLAAVDRLIPPGAEVIAGQDVVGRLAMGREAYSYSHFGQLLPVTRSEVVVVLAGATPATARVTLEGGASVRQHQLYAARDVRALLVEVPSTAHWLTIG